jgi:hypothetical protein
MNSRTLPIVSVSFRFVGSSFDPADVTRRLGIEPTTHYRSGDPIQREVGRRQRDGWAVTVGPRETLEIQGMLHELRERLHVPTALVRQICTELELAAMIRCTVEPTSTLTPVLAFPADVVSWAADIDASVDVDVMLWEAESA